MQKLYMVVMMLFLISMMITGCGVAQEKYDAIAVDLNNTQSELQATKSELELASSEIEAMQGKLGSANLELESIKTEFANSQAKVSELTSGLEKVKTDLETKQAELDIVSEELNEIKKVYPPGDFPSLRELQNWLLQNDVSERPLSNSAENLYSKALQIQEDALKDGYLVSVDIDPAEYVDQYYIACVTIIDGDIWAWDPETDEPFNWSQAVLFMKVK